MDQGTEMAACYFDNEAMETFSVYVFCFACTVMAWTEWNKNGFQGTMVESPYVIKYVKKYLK